MVSGPKYPFEVDLEAELLTPSQAVRLYQAKRCTAAFPASLCKFGLAQLSQLALPVIGRARAEWFGDFWLMPTEASYPNKAKLPSFLLRSILYRRISPG